MKTVTFKDLPCAYALHYHFVCQTKFNRPVLDPQAIEASLQHVCELKGYHSLDKTVQPDKLLALLSLRAEHSLATVANAIKSNTARALNLRFPDLAASFKGRSLWAIGYYVRSVGKASRVAAQAYIDNQSAHHGIRSKPQAELLRWRNPSPCRLTAAHIDFDLSYHVVLVTERRIQVFDDEIAPGLFIRLAASAATNGFYVERASLQADHVHLLIKTTTRTCIRDCVETLMNDSLEFMTDRYWGVLKATEAHGLWTPSFYVGTVGDRTTAVVKHFLSRPYRGI